MATYRIYLAAEASQTIEVDADSFAEACEKAYNLNDLFPNVTNRFEMGDIEILRDACDVDGGPIPDDAEDW